MGGRDVPLDEEFKGKIDDDEAIACGMAVSSIVNELTKIDARKRFAVLHAAATCLGLSSSGVIVDADAQAREEMNRRFAEAERAAMIFQGVNRVVDLIVNRYSSPISPAPASDPEPEPEAGSGPH